MPDQIFSAHMVDAFLLTYFLILNSFYAFILLLGFPALFRRAVEISAEDVNHLFFSEHLLPVTIIIPVYNERDIIQETISSVYNLDYPHYFLIIVNDGSDDDTLQILKEKYDLAAVPPPFPERVKTKPVKNVYRSKKLPNFIVIDKERGAKEDALNAGLNACTTPFYLATDADALLEPDLLRRLSLPLLIRKNTIALGGALRVANGCTIEKGLVKEAHLPKKYFAKMQVIEYFRSFFFGRLGWNILGGPFIICGVFSFLDKNTVLEIGGYRANVPAEDLDLIIRMHGKMHEQKRKYTIEHVGDASVWTEVPQDYKSLSRQRQRWYCSALDVCWKYKYMCFNPAYGRVGMLYLPYLLLGEALSPLIELFGYLYIVFAWIVGVLNLSFFWMFILISLGYSTLLTFISLGMEQMTARKYNKTTEIIRLILYGCMENLGYRQLNVLWRVQGFFRFFFFPKKRSFREHPTRYSFRE